MYDFLKHMVSEHKNEFLDYMNIPLENEKTYDLIPQIEKKASKQLQEDFLKYLIINNEVSISQLLQEHEDYILTEKENNE